MRITFAGVTEMGIAGLNGGSGTTYARMAMTPNGKAMVSRLPAGASIGEHGHPTSCEVNYVLAGTGIARCDGAEEPLEPGVCHWCPRGSRHAIANTGTSDLVLFTVVCA